MKYLVLVALVMMLGVSARAQSADPLQDSLTVTKEGWVKATHPPEPMDSLSNLIVYPENARRTGIEGVVEVKALIGMDGFVLRAKVERSSNAIFDDAAFRAVNKMRYRPATANGVATRAWITEYVKFKLPN